MSRAISLFLRLADHDCSLRASPRPLSESYAGTYLPNIASVIHKHNKIKPTPSSISIPLKSVLIGNGLTDAYTQFASVPDWSCNEPETPGANPYGPIFDDATCQSIRGKVPTCQRLTEFCYNNPSRFVESSACLRHLESSCKS